MNPKEITTIDEVIAVFGNYYPVHHPGDGTRFSGKQNKGVEMIKSLNSKPLVIQITPFYWFDKQDYIATIGYKIFV